MKNKKNLKQLLLALVLVLGLTTVSGISAYFTATDTATNNFNVKKVDVQLDEPDYEDDQDVTPNETIVKNPTVTNIGTTGQFVFLSVKVPYANVITADLDGTRNEAADIELFTWNSTEANGAINAEKTAGTGEVNDGWTLVRTNDLTDDGMVEYIYAYGSADAMTVLDVDGVTAPLFESVTMANVIEGQGLEETKVMIDIDVYAIQDTDLAVSGNGTTVPTEVLDIYLTQNQ